MTCKWPDCDCLERGACPPLPPVPREPAVGCHCHGMCGKLTGTVFRADSNYYCEADNGDPYQYVVRVRHD